MNEFFKYNPMDLGDTRSNITTYKQRQSITFQAEAMAQRCTSARAAQRKWHKVQMEKMRFLLPMM